MIRPVLAETKRYGEYSQPGEFIYDHPFQWGSRRIGPDLAREGGKQSHLWHALHFKNPTDMTPRSIMPPYPWLLEDKIDFASIPMRIGAMVTLGVPYKDEVDNGESLARKQADDIAKAIADQKGPADLKDKKVIALIAYLQRMGTDLNRPAVPVPTVPVPAPAPAAGGNP
jgi:cytochrome c oxidase cbb3-type subunit I/II